TRIHPREDLRHRRLTDRHPMRDLVLRQPFGLERQDLAFPVAHPAPRLPPALAAPSAAPTLRAHDARRRRVVGRTRTARWPVKASHRVIAACTYRGSMSITHAVRPVFCAAIRSVPLPINGS